MNDLNTTDDKLRLVARNVARDPVQVVAFGGCAGGSPVRGGDPASPNATSTQPGRNLDPVVSVATERPARRNRHPVDELADIRTELRRLKEREDEIRALLVTGEVDLLGDQFEATITEKTSERLDTRAARKALGDNALRPFLRRVTFTTVRLAEREAPEETGE